MGARIRPTSLPLGSLFLIVLSFCIKERQFRLSAFCGLEGKVVVMSMRGPRSSRPPLFFSRSDDFPPQLALRVLRGTASSLSSFCLCRCFAFQPFQRGRRSYSMVLCCNPSSFLFVASILFSLFFVSFMRIRSNLQAVTVVYFSEGFCQPFARR